MTVKFTPVLNLPHSATFRKFLLSILLLLAGFNLPAQVANYTFNQFQGTYTSLTGATVVATAIGTTGNDALDDRIFVMPTGTIPFSFAYDNGSYTSFTISTNGFITFGSSPAVNGSTTGYTPLSAATAYTGAISPLGRNLAAVFVAANDPENGSISYKTEGSAPNREFVIQYRNFRLGTQSTTTAKMSFQIRLQETTNRIRFVYSFAAQTITAISQVGLRGANNNFAAGNVKNRKVTGGVNTWLTSVDGTDNVSTCSTSASLIPPTGLTYEFIVLCSWPKNLTYYNSTATSSTLSWKNGQGGVYEVEYGPQGFTPGTGTIVNVADTLLTVNGLTANTNYHFYVRRNCTASGNGYSVRVGPQLFRTGTIGEDCATAVTLPVSSSQATCVSTLINNGVSSNGPFALCSDSVGRIGNTDTWMKFTAPAGPNPQKLVIQTSPGTTNDWVMEVWNGCPNSPGSNVIACSDDSIGFMPVIALCQNSYIPGNTYYIRAWTYNSSLSGNMSICVFQNGLCIIPPTYDECVDAATIPINPPLSCPGAAQTFTTQFATASGSPVSTCDATTMYDVWLKFNTGTSGPFKINVTPGTASGLKAAIIFECGSFEVACWDPATGPYVASGLNPVADYLLRVWTPQATQGTFNVCLEDVCDDATAALSGNTAICAGGTAQLRVDLTGMPPWNFTWSNGTTNTNVVTSTTPYFISVSPTVNTSYSLVSLNSVVCAGTVWGTASVTLIQPPTVTLAPFPTICSNVAYTMSEGSPAGGVYSGPGVSGKTFYASQVGAGTYQITYTAGSGSGCARSATQPITVLSAPSITGFSPTISPIGSVVNIYGSGFTPTATVMFNGMQATSVVFVSAGQLNVTVPNGASTGYISITLTNGCGTVSTAIFGVGATPVNTTLNLKVFLQGFYAGGSQMMPVLDPANPLVCDSITVELRNSINPSQVIAVRHGLLGTNGTSAFYYPSGIGNNSYYIVVKHRSCLETWSKSPVYFPVGGALTYDFSVPPPGTP